jgi:hypothetical protein
MTLEKRNVIINYIGWREINDTDTGNWYLMPAAHEREKLAELTASPGG